MEAAIGENNENNMEMQDTSQIELGKFNDTSQGADGVNIGNDAVNKINGTVVEVVESIGKQETNAQSDGETVDRSETRDQVAAGGPFHDKPPPLYSAPPAFRGGRGGAIVLPFGGRGGRGGIESNFVPKNPGGFEQNWPNPNGPPPNASGAQLELWVETKTDEGKSYFYHAITRETTWNKPEGPNVRVMSQSEIEEMNKKQQQMQQQLPNAAVGPNAMGKPGQENLVAEQPKNSEALTAQAPPNVLTQPPPTQQLTQPPPNVGLVPPGGGPPMTQQPPPGMHQQPPPFFQPGMHPPNFSQPPYGMPPPGYGGFPGGPAPWGMHWNQHMHAPPAQQHQDKPAKNLIIKPGVIDPAVIARAAEWSEHRAPDGRPYYYHAARGESVWEKPQALRDMEAARMAAHSGATPQQAAPPQVPPMMQTGMSHMIPNPLMHMPPGTGPAAAFDPALAYNAAAAAAAAMKANNEVTATIVQQFFNCSDNILQHIA